ARPRLAGGEPRRRRRLPHHPRRPAGPEGGGFGLKFQIQPVGAPNRLKPGPQPDPPTLGALVGVPASAGLSVSQPAEAGTPTRTYHPPGARLESRLQPVGAFKPAEAGTPTRTPHPRGFGWSPRFSRFIGLSTG